MGQDHPFPNAQLLDTAALLPASVFHEQADVLHYPAPRATPAKSFPGTNQGLEAEPSRNSETPLGGSVSASGVQNFVLARTPYQPVGHLGGGFADRPAGPPQLSRLPTSGAPPRGAAPMVIRAGEEAQFYVYDSARTLSEGSPAIGLLSPSWVEAGLAMRVGTVDSQGLALVLAKNNTHNFLTLSPSPQSLLDAHGVRLPESWLPQVDPAAAIKLPASMTDIQSLIRGLPSDGWIPAVEQLVGLAAEEDTDMALYEIASTMLSLHYTNSVLNGPTVLHLVRKLASARLPGHAGHDLPPFRDAFLKMVQRLRRIAVNNQPKLRQPAPATSVRFTEPSSRPDSSRQFVVDVDASSSGRSAGVLSQRDHASYSNLLTPVPSYPPRTAVETVLPVQWQAANQPSTLLATPSSLQYELPPQFGAYGQGYSGAGAAFAPSQQHAPQSAQQPGIMHFEQPMCGGFGSAPHGGAGRDLGSGAGVRQTQSAPPTPGARHGVPEDGPQTRDVAVSALLELAKASQSSHNMSFNFLVVEHRKVLMETRCPQWYSAKPFAGFAAIQDIKPYLGVLERVSISEHALTFPPHNDKAFKQNLVAYGMSRCDTLEKTLENVYWFSLSGTGQVTMETATSKALAILLSACESNREVAKRSATLNQASRAGGEAGLLKLIQLLDDELLPVSKQKATQEFKDLSAGDEDNLAMVLLNFCNVGSRCGKTDAEVIEAFLDLLRKLCDGADYSMWFCTHVAERYVNRAHAFADTTALYAELRVDVAAKRPIREYRKDRPSAARDRSRMPSASANAALGYDDGMEDAIEALSNAAIESRVPPRKDPVTGKPRAVVPGPLNIPLIAKSGKLPQFNEIVLKRGTAGIDCQGCKHRKGGEFKAEFANREDYRKKHGSVPYGDRATRRIMPDEVIKHDLLHCLTLWRIVWDWVDQNEEDWEFCVPVEGAELQAITALMA